MAVAAVLSSIQPMNTLIFAIISLEHPHPTPDTPPPPKIFAFAGRNLPKRLPRLIVPSSKMERLSLMLIPVPILEARSMLTHKQSLSREKTIGTNLNFPSLLGTPDHYESLH